MTLPEGSSRACRQAGLTRDLELKMPDQVRHDKGGGRNDKQPE